VGKKALVCALASWGGGKCVYRVMVGEVAAGEGVVPGGSSLRNLQVVQEAPPLEVAGIAKREELEAVVGEWAEKLGVPAF
jgi:hypothetical protein